MMAISTRYPRLMVFAAVMALISVVVSRTFAATPPDTPAPAVILIRDGKIAEVGQSIAKPPGAEVMDANGQFVMPGIIDCHSHIAVDGSVNEGSVPVSSMVNIADE